VGKAIKKLKLVHEEISLGVLIHCHVRAAVEQAVHEELAAVLGVELYELRIPAIVSAEIAAS